MTVHTGTPVARSVMQARARRRRIAKLGPHRRGHGRRQLIPYERIAESFINAVELELPPVTVTAVVVSVDKLWLEHKLWNIRNEGWLPKGPSPLPGEDRTVWLATARKLLADRVSEQAAFQEHAELLRRLTRDRYNAGRRKCSARPSVAPLDRFGLL